MLAIFYDRKNNREVNNLELMFINFHKSTLGELGYKSEYCRQDTNWDLACMYTDLVFLRFE